MDPQAPQLLPSAARVIRDAAKIAADRLLDQAWDSDIYPVDPFAIAEKSGLSAQIMDIPEDVSGILRKRPGEKPVIYVDADDNWRRQRFTCAHELGHYIQRSERAAFRDGDSDDFGYVDRRSDLSSQGTNPSEIYANAFAANLLMPSAAVESLARLGMAPRDLAKFFDVSHISMEYRLKTLGLD